jgi:hypothetical protein
MQPYDEQDLQAVDQLIAEDHQDSGGTPPAAAAPAPSTTTTPEPRMPGGNIRVSVAGNSTITESDLTPERTGILATARTRTGLAVREAITPANAKDVLVKVGKVELPVDRAAALGLVKLQDGEYVSTPEAERVAAAQAEQAETEEAKAAERAENSFPPLPEASDAFLGELHGALTKAGSSPDGFVAGLRVGGIDRVASDLMAVSKQTGKSVEEIKGSIEAVANDLRAQQWVMAEDAGVDPREFEQWVDSKFTQSERNRAYLRQLRGDASFFRHAISKFKEIGGAGRGAAPEGVTVKRAANGTEIVEIKLPSGKVAQMSLKAAKAGGWV